MRETTNFGLGNNEKKEQNIMRLRAKFQKKEVITVASAVNEFGVNEKTVINWCKVGDIPLIGKNGTPIVGFTAENMPKWW